MARTTFCAPPVAPSVVPVMPEPAERDPSLRARSVHVLAAGQQTAAEARQIERGRPVAGAIGRAHQREQRRVGRARDRLAGGKGEAAVGCGGEKIRHAGAERDVIGVGAEEAAQESIPRPN